MSSNLESSFELLSSMSPRFKSAKNNKKIVAPHKLSLKKHFRKSISFDSKPHSQNLLDSSVIIIRDSLSNESLPNNIQILKAPIIISSSSESEKSNNELDQENLTEQIEIEQSDRQLDEYQVDLGAKYDEINSWLEDNEKLDSYSEVSSFKHTSFSDTDNETCSPKNKPVDNKQQWHIVAIESKTGVDEFQVQSKTMCTNEDVIDDSLTELNNTAENLLDELYGESWRKNREKVLSRTEPKKTKKLPISMPKTERKPQNTKPKTPWLCRLNDLVDSDTETRSTASTKSNSINCNKRLSYSDSEDDSEPFTSRTHRKMVTKAHQKQFDINFSGNDSDSLGTKVRKKLAKKAKDLQSVKIVGKKLAENIPRSKTTEKSKKATITSEKLKKAIVDLEAKCPTHSFLKSLSGCVPSWLCHDEAKQYKSNFKSKREDLARKLFDLYNREIFNNAIPSDTELQWNDRIRGSAGFCYNKRITKSNGTVLRSCRIVLANKVLDTADRLRDTLVHEMCHAATWLVNNVSDGHGPYWKSWAHKAMKIFPELPQIKRCHDYQINTKYTYKCVDCGYSIGRHSKSLDMERKRCGYCYGKFEVFINKVNKNGEKQCRPTTPKGKPTGFALFVKENYSSVKRDDLKHGDVMKLLGRQFSALKIAQNCK